MTDPTLTPEVLGEFGQHLPRDTETFPRVVDDSMDAILVKIGTKTLRIYRYACADTRTNAITIAREFVDGWGCGKGVVS